MVLFIKKQLFLNLSYCVVRNVYLKIKQNSENLHIFILLIRSKVKNYYTFIVNIHSVVNPVDLFFYFLLSRTSQYAP